MQWLLTTKPPQSFWGCSLAGLSALLPQDLAEDALALTQPHAHTHTLTHLANDAQLSSPLPSLAHQCPRSYVVSKLGTGEEKEAQLLIYPVLCGEV